ncbi:hypothetical protein BASA83_001922 [Batrachochytrium salamandrivorans]|nr:hypothetical protein BASA83_001922 [Batrachochytrium salamandrivorans]
MTSPNNYTITLKLDLDFQTTFHVVERGWSAGLASIYMSVHEILVNCRFGMKLSASVSSPSYTGAQKQDGPDQLLLNLLCLLYYQLFVVPIYCRYWSSTAALCGSTAGAVAKVLADPLYAPLWQRSKYPAGSGLLSSYSLSLIYIQSAPVATSACAVVRRIPYYSTFSIPPAFLSSHCILGGLGRGSDEVPTEAACSAVGLPSLLLVAAQAMFSVLDCDVVASPLAAPHSYDKPFWERSSRRKVVALPSLHMAMVDYNDWLITYDSRGSVVFHHERP